ncbi:MAG: hypothetical protein OZX49_02176 [Immundisolibacter sp.]|nr:hypothetical protein [Immundisolibacter sp.]
MVSATSSQNGVPSRRSEYQSKRAKPFSSARSDSIRARSTDDLPSGCTAGEKSSGVAPITCALSLAPYRRAR